MIIGQVPSRKLKEITNQQYDIKATDVHTCFQTLDHVLNHAILRLIIIIIGFREAYKPVPLKDTNIFKPLQVGSIQLDHRVVLAPLTRFRTNKGVPNDLMVEYYRQRSSRKGTLLISEGTFITAGAGGYEAAPGIYTDEQIAKWKNVTKAVHDNKSFIFFQLWALGRQSFPAVLARDGHKFVSASDDMYMNEESRESAVKSNNPLHGLDKSEIKQYVADYVTAAKNSLDAGADGVEIHDANGYLLNQFLDPKTNKRTDEYGGSIENKARFTLEVVDALIEAIGADKVGFRFSPFGIFGAMSGVEDTSLVAQYAYLFGELERRAQAGNRLAYIHLVEPSVIDLKVALITADGSGFKENDGIEGVSNDFIYSIWKGAVIKAGNYGAEIDRAIKDVSRNNQTALAYGRLYISNPDLPDRLYHGYKVNQYDRATFYTPGGRGYIDYPTYEEAITNGFPEDTKADVPSQAVGYKEAAAEVQS